MTDRSSTLFHETLRGVPRWLGVALVVAGLGGALAILSSSARHFSDPVFWIAALPGVAAAVLAPVAIAMWRLDTDVRAKTVAIQLRPFTKRVIPLAEIESCEARMDAPISEYLGWGWRVGPSGRALTVPGRHGVQLTLRDGQHLLISSARSDELAEAIRSAQRCV